MAKRKRLTKKQRKRRKNLLVMIFLAILVFIGGYITGHKDLDFSFFQEKLDTTINRIDKKIEGFSSTNKKDKKNNSDASKATEERSEVHIFDLGQGASVLLVARDGSNILIDTGPYDDPEKEIISYLDEKIGLGGEIDLLIFSNNDSDYIGHGDLVLEYFDVQEVWMNGIDDTTKVYSDLLDRLLESTTAYKEPKAGENYDRNSFDIQILNPEADSTGKFDKDESLVIRIEFDGLSLMSSGDASILRENEIADSFENLKTDILILGHHGANDSTGSKWLSTISPELSFYQTAKDNTYNYPGEETTERLKEAGIPVYGTDELGTISLFVDELGEFDLHSSHEMENGAED